ncbi:putative phosphoribosyltransferase [Couchioplanes caeruleus]|uniref:Phosphoribosyltransferase n=3 Tax=Couchioplanes caeruleus TaxID=56438 RepID=A0A1K0GQP5_9ACTN|nr:phosphoribosyltransferase [Couchioplanes caeruleus subsp. caeruleus]ROP27347.1 putative phosphoribosyltransferase [Couchioplanes caeruleus]
MVARHLGNFGLVRRPLVLALPRGGVPVAARVAAAVGADLDLVVARKIGAPGRPELGVGAIAEDGEPVFDDELLATLGLTPPDLSGIVEAERRELARRIEVYRDGQPPPEVTDRLAIVVDDGVATGVTARAALRWLRSRGAHPLVLAAPVCSREADHSLAADADLVICLERPARFGAVGRFYEDFAQLTDADVRECTAVRDRQDHAVSHRR